MRPKLEYAASEFPPSLSYLSEIERLAGYPLPVEIRAHFITHNGGETLRSILSLDGKDPRTLDAQYLRVNFTRAMLPLRLRDSDLVVLTVAASRPQQFCVVLGPDYVGMIVAVKWFPDAPCLLLREVAPSFEAFQDMLLPDHVDDWNPRGGYDTLTTAEKTYVDFVPYLPNDDTVRLRHGPSLTRELQFVDCLPPVTDEHFAWIEQGFHIRIPLDIREHYQRSNGGRPAQYQRFPFAGELYTFNEFYSMQYPVPLGESGRMMELGMFEHRCRELKWSRKFIPAHLFPIAMAYDEICFSSREEDFGSIWTWTHNIYEQGFKKIADSFNEFLNSLQDAP